MVGLLQRRVRRGAEVGAELEFWTYNDFRDALTSPVWDPATAGPALASLPVAPSRQVIA